MTTRRHNLHRKRKWGKTDTEIQTARMFIPGLISVTIAAISYLVALVLFYNPTKYEMATYVMVGGFVFSIMVMFLRIFELLTFSGKLGTNNCCYTDRRKFRIATIVLGIICALLVMGVTVMLILTTIERSAKWNKGVDNIINCIENIQERRNTTTDTTTTIVEAETKSKDTRPRRTFITCIKEKRIRECIRDRRNGLFDKHNELDSLSQNGEESAFPAKASTSYSTHTYTSTHTWTSSYTSWLTTSPGLQNLDHNNTDTKGTLLSKFKECRSNGGTKLKCMRDVIASRTKLDEWWKKCINKTEEVGEEQDILYDIEETEEEDSEAEGGIERWLKGKVSKVANKMYIIAGFLGLSCLVHIVNVIIAIRCNGDTAYVIQSDEEQKGQQEGKENVEQNGEYSKIEEAVPLKQSHNNENLTEKDPANI